MALDVGNDDFIKPPVPGSIRTPLSTGQRLHPLLDHTLDEDLKKGATAMFREMKTTNQYPINSSDG